MTEDTRPDPLREAVRLFLALAHPSSELPDRFIVHRGDIDRLRRALAASGAGLDVERLARAIAAYIDKLAVGHVAPHALWVPSIRPDMAADIAAEYARLSGAVTEPEP